MLKFTLEEITLPFSFLDAVDFSYYDSVTDALKVKYPTFTEEDCDKYQEMHTDAISEIMHDLKYCLADYKVEELEVNEATGTWGYISYELDDLNVVRNMLDNETQALAKIVIDKIESDQKSTTKTNVVDEKDLRVNLYAYKSESMTINVDAYFKDERLELEGHDLCSTVEGILGSSEYEYFLSVSKAELPKLYQALNLELDKRSLLLSEIKTRFNGKTAFSDFMSWLEEKEIKGEFFSFR